MSALIWGKYKIETTPIGTGKQGVVFKGWDPIEEVDVAIKRMENIPEAQSEAMIMKKYGKHKHLSEFHDFFILENEAYLVIKWIDGDNLKNMDICYNTQKAVQTTLNLLEGLKHLHNNGILHCDIYPSNIIMEKNEIDTVKLTDFGIAVQKDEDEVYKGKHIVKRRKIFCPPEQRESDIWILDDSSDLYRIAGICFYLITGRLPRRNRRTNAHQCSLKNKSLQKILNKAMHHNRNYRYRSADEMIKALKPFVAYTRDKL